MIWLKGYKEQSCELTWTRGPIECLRQVTPLKRSSTPKYQTVFFVLCYACNNFGHKAVNCRANSKNKKNFESHTQRVYPRRPSETQRRSYNMFESLSTEVECYKCKKNGHMEKDCRMTVPPREQQQNNNSHRQEPQKNSIAMKNAHFLYKLSRRNMVGMLTVGVQNIWQVIDTCF
jgi:uncharacterized membrane protein